MAVHTGTILGIIITLIAIVVGHGLLHHLGLMWP